MLILSLFPGIDLLGQVVQGIKGVIFIIIASEIFGAILTLLYEEKDQDKDK